MLILLTSCIDQDLPKETFTYKDKVSSTWISNDSLIINIAPGTIKGYAIKNNHLRLIMLQSINLNFPKKKRSYNALHVIKDRRDTMFYFEHTGEFMKFKGNLKPFVPREFIQMKQTNLDSLKDVFNYSGFGI